MKAALEHRVPLTDRAIELVQEMHELRRGKFIFPGRTPGHPMSDTAFDKILRHMGLEITTHGFRSSFRDWAGEASSFPRELAEAALAHMVGDATERAYRRSDALEKRRKLMVAWAMYCSRGSRAKDDDGLGKNILPFVVSS
jgi:integrase